ncbi:DUF427 domain-containing protein [uncultured Marixanthomonas sp.]|uniref:DUF427 domain-containing protein n=1 Tax=uncultured Marixanthomonas sp. TaxID=757245 RepID=UPI0030D9F3FF|tara:strand:+ start:469 stop:750 length:282 start_codon:yes stop_codon:yes gene_type:complete
MKAIWNETILAESDDTIVIENNHYFPPNTINEQYFTKSESHSHCPWKGQASYYTLNVGGEKNPDAAWFYPEASHAAKSIEGYIAFWKGVEVVE